MVAYTTSVGYNRGTAAASNADNRFSWMSVKLDFAAIKAARLAAGATALAAADTIQVLAIPANFLIFQGGIEVTSAEATNTTATVDVGFTGGSPAAANVFGDNVAMNATGATATGLAAPLLITTADTLDLLLNTAVPVDAVAYVWLCGMNVDNP